MKTAPSLENSVLELLGNINRTHRAVFDASFNFVYCNRPYEEMLQKQGFQPDASLSLFDLYNSSAKEHAELWLDAFKMLHAASDSYAFSAFSNKGEQQFRLDAEVKAVYKDGQVKAFALGFDELTDAFLETRFNRLRSEFLAKALMVCDIEELVWVLVDELLAKLDLGDALILLRDGNVLVPAAAYGSERKGAREVASGLKVSFSKGITGYVATTGEAYMTGDCRKDPHYIQEHFAAGSEVAVPILVNGKVFGVINCESEHLHFFRSIHLNLLQRTAEVLSARIQEVNSLKELELLEQQHLAILNSTPNSFLLFNKKLRLMSFNTAAVKAWRHFKKQAIAVGDAHHVVIPTEFISNFESNAARSIQGEQAVRYLSMDDANGLSHRLKLSFAPARNRSNVIFGFTVLVEDVSELYQANLNLQARNAQLEQGNKELDKFVYSISHDLRAPLSSMMGLVNLIENAQQLPETKIYAKMLQDAADSMDSYIRNVLEYSRNKRLEVEFEEIDLDELIRDMEQKFRFIPGYRELQFETDFEIKTLRSDAYRIEIILNNLISNAIKYRDLGKRQSWCKVTIKEDGDHYLISVADNGIGVPKIKLGNLFDMFFKVKTDHPGSGLGLYILKEVVDNLHGQIMVESKEKKGSTFGVLLPKNPPNG